MKNSYYKLKINGKDIKRFIRSLYKNGVYFEEITYRGQVAFIKVDYSNYLKIMNTKTIYEITVVKLYGFIKIKDFIERYFFFLISLFIGTLFLFLLSNIIFEVEVIHTNKDIRELLYKELDKYNIKRFTFTKSFSNQEDIVKKILNNNKDTIEWMEIEKIGAKYEIRVEPRIIKKKEEDTVNRHIVAKKDGTIISIEAEKGEILKRINSYVRKGEILISGNIMRNEEIKSIISAKGKVYAEVWYKVLVELPTNYKETIKTNNTKKALNIQLLGYNFNLFDFKPYKSKNIEEIFSLKDNLFLFAINLNNEEEVITIDEIYDLSTAEIKANELAKKKIESILSKGEEIISQKNLKIEQKNSKIVSTVFFKVKEDITSYLEIKEEDNESKKKGE